MNTHDADVLVVGAGIAGLTAALQLAAEGLDVKVVEKSRGFGGRAATRRVLEGWPADFGAQFFTARSAAFQAQVAEWESQGLIRVWTRDSTCGMAGV